MKLTGCPAITFGLLEISRTFKLGVKTTILSSAVWLSVLSEPTIMAFVKFPDLVVFTTIIKSMLSPTSKGAL